MAVVGPVDSLLALKIITLLAVSLTPLSWAWAHHVLLRPSTSIALTAAIYYIAFFGLDRTILFSLPFAGKTSLLLGLSLLPIVAVTCKSCAERIYLIPISALAVFGLIIINYSVLHALCAFLLVFGLVLYRENAIPFRQLLTVAIIGVVACALMLTFLHEALTDPRAGTFSFRPLAGVGELVRTLISRQSPIVIYDDANFGVTHSYYRGAVLIICFAVSALANDRNVRLAGLAFFSAIILILCFGFNVIPAGITLDYARWILWPFQAALIASALLGLADPRVALGPARIALALGCIAGALLIAMDARTFLKVNAAQALSRVRLEQVAQAIHPSGSCFLIASSRNSPQRLVTMEPDKALDYAEVVTPCQYATGSWVQPGIENGRSDGGLPPASVVADLLSTGQAYFIGTPDQKDSYLRRIPDFSFRLSGTIGDFEVWEISPSHS